MLKFSKQNKLYDKALWCTLFLCQVIKGPTSMFHFCNNLLKNHPENKPNEGAA